jgi:probable H4MPT-linked C1 transfer pathway protein
VIGIDVGGANLKVVTSDGVFLQYCPLWEESPLSAMLKTYATGEEEAAVVISGELADCFTTKMEGISFIVDAVQEVFPQARFYGTDAVFHDRAVPGLAAANWLVSADYLIAWHRGGLLVDFGSTTTDIIPLIDLSRLKGMTDLSRLQNDYLVYTGLLRTTIPALVRSVTLGGVPTRVCPEYFACSADAHLVLDHIREDEYTIGTPDGKGNDRLSCLRRLSRVVCADLEETGEDGAMAIAETFWNAQRSLISRSVQLVKERTGADRLLCAGIGAPLLSGLLGGYDLRQELGLAADALPAFAVKEVALRDPGTWR